jgi:hypothetical protein
MGGIDNKSMDFSGWTREDCAKAAREICTSRDTRGLIPCITQGGPGSTFPGAYKVLVEEIDKVSEEIFGIDAAAIERMPLQILF